MVKNILIILGVLLSSIHALAMNSFSEKYPVLSLSGKELNVLYKQGFLNKNRVRITPIITKKSRFCTYKIYQLESSHDDLNSATRILSFKNESGFFIKKKHQISLRIQPITDQVELADTPNDDSYVDTKDKRKTILIQSFPMRYDFYIMQRTVNADLDEKEYVNLYAQTKEAIDMLEELLAIEYDGE